LKTLLTAGIGILTLVSCEKDVTSNSFDPFYQVIADGLTKNVYACGTSDYVCQYLKDTAMFVGIGCGGQSAGFYLKGNITDRTYTLDNINQAFYRPNQSLTFKTNTTNKGTLTI